MRGSGWFLFSALLLCALPSSAQLQLERVELTAHLDPEAQAIYAKARLLIRNRTPRELENLELILPPPLGERFEPTAVWDREGELAWRSDPPEATSVPRIVQIALRSWLRPGKRADIVVSYEILLEDFQDGAAPLQLSATRARLAATGWYPQPLTAPTPASRRPPPGSLRLAVRLPKQWRVDSPVKLKRLRDGTTLASYELKMQPVRENSWLMTARAPSPP